MPDGAVFNGTQNILPKEYFQSLKIGDVLEDPIQNPLIWHRRWNGESRHGGKSQG
jgi:hypothetical protein